MADNGGELLIRRVEEVSHVFFVQADRRVVVLGRLGSEAATATVAGNGLTSTFSPPSSAASAGEKAARKE